MPHHSMSLAYTVVSTVCSVAGLWRAKMKGYETSSRKAAMLLRLLRRQKRASGISDPHTSQTLTHRSESPRTVDILQPNGSPVMVQS